MIKQRTDEDFYMECSNFMASPGRKRGLFASKTPVLFLHEELRTQNRRDYRAALLRGVQSGKLDAHYCFAWRPTAERLQSVFDVDQSIREAAAEHLSEIKRLIENSQIDLRYSETVQFSSGMVTDKVGLIHYKPPQSLETEWVDVVSGKDLKPHRRAYNLLFEKLPRFDDVAFTNLLNDAKRIRIEKYLLPKWKEFSEDASKELSRTWSIEEAILHLLRLPSLPASAEIHRTLDSYARNLSNGEREEYLNSFIKPFLEQFSFLSGTGLKESHPVVCPVAGLVRSMLIPPTQQPTEPGKRQVTVEFTENHVIIDNEPTSKTAPLLLAEYLILRGKEVHFLWAFVMLPEFRTRDAAGQFLNYISKAKTLLSDCGIHISRLKRPYDHFGSLTGIEDRVVSKVRDVRGIYDEAVLLHEGGDIGTAISVLSRIAEREYEFFTFTEAWMTLAGWVATIGFEDVSHSVLKRISSFLRWYVKKLEIGISRIEAYRNKKGLDRESLEEHEKIKKELNLATRLSSAFADRLPLAPWDQDYEDLVSLLLATRKELVNIREQGRPCLQQETDLIEVIKQLESQNHSIARVVEYGRELVGAQIERRRDDDKYGDVALAEIYEEVYFCLAEVIVELESFEEFDRGEGDRKALLENQLRSRLSRKLRRGAR